MYMLYIYILEYHHETLSLSHIVSNRCLLGGCGHKTSILLVTKEVLLTYFERSLLSSFFFINI